jgi:hypothetical protein
MAEAYPAWKDSQLTFRETLAHIREGRKMKKKIAISVVIIAVFAGLLSIAHLVDFMGTMEKLHGG